MNRKIIICLLTTALLSIALFVDAQQPKKVPRIGILPPGLISERMHLWEAFRQGLRELGYVEGQNIALQFPSGEVKTERLPELAAELVRSDVNIFEVIPAS